MTPAMGAGLTPPTTKTQVAGASGGGSVATQAGGSTATTTAPSATLAASLQQLVAAVKSLADVIGRMSGAVAGGGGGVTQLQLNNQFAGQIAANHVSQTSMAGMNMESMAHDHDMGPANGGKQTVLQGSAKELLNGPLISARDMSNSTTTSSGKVVFGRTAPEDRTKAGALINKLMSSTTKYQDANAAKAAGYDFTKFAEEGGGLVHAIKPGGQNLNLEEPGMLLYRRQPDGNLKLIGTALGANGAAPDLGMGSWHVHGAGNINMMKHVWFTPGNLDTAFNEATPPASVI